MNDAESTPSPKRFCSRLGIFSAALNASAAAPFPKKCANTYCRTKPAIRLRRMRAPTSAAARRGAIAPSSPAAGASPPLRDALVPLGSRVASSIPSPASRHIREIDGPRKEPRVFIFSGAALRRVLGQVTSQTRRERARSTGVAELRRASERPSNEVWRSKLAQYPGFVSRLTRWRLLPFSDRDPVHHERTARRRAGFHDERHAPRRRAAVGAVGGAPRASPRGARRAHAAIRYRFTAASGATVVGGRDLVVEIRPAAARDRDRHRRDSRRRRPLA